MNSRFPLASTAALMADPARSAMLTALLNTRSLSAGELARSGDVSAQSASMHLAQLLAGGFLKVTQEGRHRYYQIASPEIAHAIEALGAISTVPSYRPSGANRDLCIARTCYDHLAGELGVNLTAALERERFLVPQGEREYEITKEGEKLLARWQINPGPLQRARRSFARRCLDWTERKHHLAGALGAAICAKFFEYGWIRRERQSRIVHITPRGHRELHRTLNL
ncbi:MAG TPA: winged helix-turn-helix domain-containing protein [Terriglobales bacterium]|jgi:DNA-binding transcriptional ArsR family regulator